MTPNTDEAWDFLRKLHPESKRFRLHGIYHERGHVPDPLPDWWYWTRDKRPAGMYNAVITSRAKLEIFLRRCHEQRLNVYYAINRSKNRTPVKLQLADITHVDFLHLDYDLKVLPEDDPVGWAKTQLQAFARGIPYAVDHKPTFTVFSGGGLQLLFRLAEPMPVDDPYVASGFNKALATALPGADAVHDVSRIFRLPGTVNWPDANKRGRGRVPAVAELWHYDPDAVVYLSRAKHEVVTPPTPGFAVMLGNVEAVDDVLSIIDETLHGTQQVDRLVLLAECGYLPYSPKKGGDVVHVDEAGEQYVAVSDKSRWVFDLVCQLLRAGCTDEQIAGYMLHTSAPIREHLDKQGVDAKRQVCRCIERAQSTYGVRRGEWLQ